MEKSAMTRAQFAVGSIAAAASVGLLGGVTGCSPAVGTAPAAPAATGATGTPISASHFGVYTPIVEDGRFVRAKPVTGDFAPNAMVESYPARVYAKNRVSQPMVRASVLKHGPGSNRAARGAEDFVPVSWDQALDLVSSELKTVKAKHGNDAIFGGSYGWQSVGKLQNSQTLLHRMLNLHGGYVDILGDYSTGASQVIMPYVVGSLEVYEQQTAWPVVLEHTDTIVLWGADLLKNNRIGFLPPDHYGVGAVHDLRDAMKRRKIHVISIDPVATNTSRFLGAQWIAPRPSTDVALMLGIAHTIYTRGKHSQPFLDKYTVGFEPFLAYLLGKSDGKPKTAAWAAAITDLDVATIEDLAQRFTSGRTMLMSGWAIQRQDHGEQPHWMLVTLASMIGQIGLPGGGFGLSYHYCSGGEPTSSDPGLTGISATPGSAGKSSLTPWLEHAPLAIPVGRVTDMLANPGKTIDYNGKRIKYPDIKFVYWAGGNPFGHQEDRNALIAAWQKPQTIVVQDFFWTATAKFADIVLPAATEIERNDIEEVGDYSGRSIVAMKRTIAPVGQARTDYDIFSAISDRLGFGTAFTEGKDDMAWIRSFYETARKSGAAQHVNMPEFDTFWQAGSVPFVVPKSATTYVRYASFRQNPALHPLGTNSGMIELFSPPIKKFAYDDCPPHATWLEPQEWLGSALAEHYPLHLLSPHPTDRLHSQLNNTPLRTTYEVAGREPVWLNPADAKARGIVSGDVVRVFNGRGQLLAGAVVTDTVRPRCAVIHEGAWYDPETPGMAGTLCKHGDVNVLTLDKGTSRLAQGNIANTSLVQVQKFHGALPTVTAFDVPKGAVSA